MRADKAGQGRKVLEFARSPLPLSQLSQGGSHIRVFLKDGSVREAHTTVVWCKEGLFLMVYDKETRKAIDPDEMTGWLEAASR
jgi:hypothetical protein